MIYMIKIYLEFISAYNCKKRVCFYKAQKKHKKIGDEDYFNLSHILTAASTARFPYSTR